MAEIKQNILYITTEGLYLHHEGEVLKVEQRDETLLKIPMHHLQGVTVLNHCVLSPSLLNKCLTKGIYVSYLTARGKFLGRLEGATSGNVLVRKAHFKKSEEPDFVLNACRSIVAGKIQNSRLNLLRSARESRDEKTEREIREAAERLATNLGKIEDAKSADEVRGYEGESARSYFSVLDLCIVQQRDDFQFEKRSRRPPRSRINALLSFVYSLMTNDCVSALQASGLDPYVGFLHVERPGRPSLALDLMEEFRAFADRFVLTLINRKQIQPYDINEKPGSVYTLTDSSRKALLVAYQERKQEEITHHFLESKTRVGELPFLQARIMARHIRGDLPRYIPYIWK